MYRFDTGEHLRAWLDSDQHAAWLEPPAACDRAHANAVRDRAGDLVHASGRPGTRPPPAYKMALVTWVSIFPLITLVVLALGPLLEAARPAFPRLAVTTAVTVPIMTWLVMPRVTGLLHGWLYPTGDSGQADQRHRGPRGHGIGRVTPGLAGRGRQASRTRVVVAGRAWG